jgi:hypothetical protein
MAAIQEERYLACLMLAHIYSKCFYSGVFCFSMNGCAEMFSPLFAVDEKFYY